MIVDEFMTSEIEKIRADRSVYDALEKMVDKRIPYLLVEFEEKETDYGIITARDLVHKVLIKNMDPGEMKVSEVASKPIWCVEKGADLREAIALMAKHNIARAFICDKEKIIGVLSMQDVMSAVLVVRARGENDS